LVGCVPQVRDSYWDRVSGHAFASIFAGMDDSDANVIPLSRGRLLKEEIRKALEWLDDLDSPLAAEQSSSLEDHTTVSERIRRARQTRTLDHALTAPPDWAS
jgi:hypothetical protein